jgi:hypothetical protein
MATVPEYYNKTTHITKTNTSNKVHNTHSEYNTITIDKYYS